MTRLAHAARLLPGLALAVTVPLPAQAPSDEFLALEPVLQAAIRRVEPCVVTVETFGGVRKVLADDSAVLADGPAPRRPKKPKPKEGGDKDKKDKKDKKDEKDGEKKEKTRLRQPGFLQSQGATTGVVLTGDGWILASRFALNFDPTTILVTLPDGRSFRADRAGEDTSRGLALLKIDAQDLPVPEFVQPSATKVGQWAFALGRTFGRKELSVHMGILSAVGRLFGRALQTDAYTSPANYGGPLIDIEGRVLGLCVPLSRAGRDAGAELYDSGIGFAATIADIGPLLERMKQGEILHRGWLGIGTVPQDLGPGARVSEIAANSPAKGADLQVGDLILAVDRIEVRNSFHLQTLISSRMGGEPVHLKIAHADGEVVGVTVFLADLPATERTPKKPAEEAGVLPWEEQDKPGSGR